MTVCAGELPGTFPFPNGNIINLYNALSAVAVLSEYGLSREKIAQGMGQLAIAESRYKEDLVGGRRVIFHLAKGMNPIACSQACRNAQNAPGKKAVLLFMDDFHEAAHSVENIAWIYDTDFEFLNDPGIVQVIEAGPRHWDTYVRLLIAGVPREKIVHGEDNPGGCPGPGRPKGWTQWWSSTTCTRWTWRKKSAPSCASSFPRSPPWRERRALAMKIEILYPEIAKPVWGHGQHALPGPLPAPGGICPDPPGGTALLCPGAGGPGVFGAHERAGPGEGPKGPFAPTGSPCRSASAGGRPASLPATLWSCWGSASKTRMASPWSAWGCSLSSPARDMLHRHNSIFLGSFEGEPVMGFKSQFTMAYPGDEGLGLFSRERGVGLNPRCPFEGVRSPQLLRHLPAGAPACQQPALYPVSAPCHGGRGGSPGLCGGRPGRLRNSAWRISKPRPKAKRDRKGKSRPRGGFYNSRW